MPRVSDVLNRIIERYLADGVTPVPSLSTSDFTLTGFRDGASQAITYSVTHVSGAKYRLNYTLPSVKGMVDAFIEPASGTDRITPRWLSGWVARNDIDSVAAGNRPAAVAAASAGIGQEFPISLVWNTYDVIEATIYEADLVTPVDLSTWNTWQFEVNNLDHSAEASLPAVINSGITGDVNGLAQVIIPENATLYTAMSTANVQNGRQLRYTLTGNQDGDAAKTRCVLRGPLTILRREKPT